MRANILGCRLFPGFGLTSKLARKGGEYVGMCETLPGCQY